MLKELYAAMAEGDDEAPWFLTLESVHWKQQKLLDGGEEIDLRLDLDRGGFPSSAWSIRCSFVLDYRFENASIDSIEHVTDAEHPLLARYVDLHASLFFRGTVEKPDELIGSLLAEHRSSCGNWTSFDSHLEETAPAALRGGHGLLARGPRRILERYATVLERYGMEPSIVGGMPFQEFRAGKRQPRTRPAEALLLGRSFVVADSFSAKRR